METCLIVTSGLLPDINNERQGGITGQVVDTFSTNNGCRMITDCVIFRCHSPLSVISKSEIAQQQVPKAISRRKRHSVVVQIIGGLLKDIIYYWAIIRHRRIRCNVSIVSPRLAQAYNPWQHFCEIIGNFRKLLHWFTITVIKSTDWTLLQDLFFFLFLFRQQNL